MVRSRPRNEDQTVCEMSIERMAVFERRKNEGREEQKVLSTVGRWEGEVERTVEVEGPLLVDCQNRSGTDAEWESID